MKCQGQRGKKGNVEVAGESAVRQRGQRTMAPRLLRILLLCVVCVLASAKDLYKVLGVDRGADDRTLKKAYRQLAL